MALKRQRQVDLCEFKANLVYRVCSRIARATQRDPGENSGERGQAREGKLETSCSVKLAWVSVHRKCVNSTDTPPFTTMGWMYRKAGKGGLTKDRKTLSQFHPYKGCGIPQRLKSRWEGRTGYSFGGARKKDCLFLKG